MVDKLDSDMRAIISVVYATSKKEGCAYSTLFDIAQCGNKVGVSLDRLEECLEKACEQGYISRTEARFFYLTSKGLKLIAS